jgi:hypothetical protein
MIPMALFGQIVFAVVIEVVLTVVLLPVDASAFLVFRVFQPSAFFGRHLAVALGRGFHGLDVRFATLETIGFMRGQTAGLNSLVDALLLVLLPLVDVRRVGLRTGGERQTGNSADGNHRKNWFACGLVEHGALLQMSGVKNHGM